MGIVFKLIEYGNEESGLEIGINNNRGGGF